MPRGGARSNSGPKSQWKHPQTKTIRVPEALAEQLLDLARQLDHSGTFELVPGSIAAEREPNVIELVTTSDLTLPPIEQADALQTLRQELQDLPVDAQERRLAEHVEAVQALRLELEASRPSTKAAPPTPVHQPKWIEPIQKHVLALPKQLSRLLVLRLLMNQHSYLQDRDRDLARRPPASSASEEVHTRHEQSRQRLAQRVQELELFFSTFPPELLAEARALVPNWQGRAAAGARRTYDSLIAKMDH